jgi:Tol biopolymer transport system component
MNGIRMSNTSFLIVRALAVCCALTVVVVGNLSESNAKSKQQKAWRIQLSSPERTVVFKQDGTRRATRPSKSKYRPWNQPSPDGSLIVYSDASDGDSEIFVVDTHGKNPRKLTDNKVDDGFPSWSPDGRQIAFASNRNGRWQIYVMDADGKNAKQFTDEKLGAMYPEYGPDGRIAYHALRGDLGKLPLVNLVVANSKKERQVIAKDVRLVELEWSPDGSTIAYSECGSLVFYHMKSGKTEEIVFKEIDPRLDSNAAGKVTWRPDSRAVACGIMFMGGRTASVGQPTDSIFGDDELFVIPLQGKVTWFKPGNGLINDGYPASLRWVQE